VAGADFSDILKKPRSDRSLNEFRNAVSHLYQKGETLPANRPDDPSYEAEDSDAD
jgi:hypothetical protein